MCLRFLLKCLLFIVNLVFVILGIALVALGVLIKVKLEGAIKEFESSLSGETNGNLSLSSLGLPIDFGTYIIIGLGIIIFVIAFCGCCGSVTESKCMLISYSVFMTVLLVIKIAALVMLITNAESVKEQAKAFVDEAFNDPQQNVTFHVIEALLQCCGSNGPDDYDLSYEGTSYVPASCCPGALENTHADTELSINATVCLREEAFTTGCSTVLLDFVELVWSNTRTVLIIVIITEGVLLLSAISIACTIKNKKR